MDAERRRSRVTIDVVLPAGYSGEAYGRLLAEKTLANNADARFVSATDYVAEHETDGRPVLAHVHVTMTEGEIEAGDLEHQVRSALTAGRPFEVVMAEDVL